MAYSARSGGSGKRKPGGSSSRGSSDRGGSARGSKSFGRKSSGDKPPFKRRDDDDKPAFKRSSSSSRTGDRKPFGDKPAFKRRSDDRDDKPAFKRRSDDDRPRKSFGDKPAFKKRYDDRDDKPAFKRSDDDRPKRAFGDKPAFKRRGDDRDDKPAFKRRSDDDRPKRAFGDKPAFKRRSDDDKPPGRGRSGDRKPFGDRGSKPTWKRGDRNESSFTDRKRKDDREEGEWKVFDKKEEASEFTRSLGGKKHRGQSAKDSYAEEAGDGTIRLNKYIANTGLCSRREADEMIEAGVIKVNGVIVTALGTKIKADDVVHYGDQPLKREKLVYILLNKPKDYITTTDDPQERKTVLDLVAGACDERVYPVGRLDRNTTGVLLLTNDGDLAERLMHPKYGVEKIYQVSLDMNLRKEDFDKIMEGIELEDGFIKADDMSFVGDGEDKKEVGIVLHSGRNRIVRRVFEHLGYTVTGLDRVGYAGLTKKNLPKGRWRMLEPKEVGFLKMKVGGDKKTKPAFAKKRNDR